VKPAAVVVGALLVLVVAGPALAPYSPTDPVGPPYALPGEFGLLGTDQLGRDVLSRVLVGGQPVVLTSLVGALAGSVAGAAVGLLSAVRRARVPGTVLMRPLDAVAAVPPMLVLLLVLTALPGRAGIVLAIAVAGAPLVARVAAAAAAPVVGRAHVEAALARGEGLAWVLGREVLPLVAGPLVADAGVRFVGAVYLVTAAGFLGLGAGAADWGQLIVEALPGAVLQPAALAAPVLLVALLAVSVNLVADDLVRRSRTVLA
jgi:ABC-type dipeptide/oligopeptide/nickel transport system permease subunit